MNNPLISVVIPSFNHDRFIKNALESVIKQTYVKWEIIVIDNHSTDNTDAILKQYSNYNLRILKINNNGVIAVSRNAGIRASNGEWIAFLDSDDSWYENKLQECVNEMNTGIDLIYHDLNIKRTDLSFLKKRMIKSRFLSKPIIIDLLEEGNCINNSSVVVRKEKLEKIGYISTDKEMIATEDFNTWLKLAFVTDGFKYIAKSLGYYTLHESGMSRKNMHKSMIASCREFMPLLSKRGKKKLRARINYANCKYLFDKKTEIDFNADLFFCIKYGNFEIKLKSLYILIMGNLIQVKKNLVELFITGAVLK